MKTKMTLVLIMIITVVITGCAQDDIVVEQVSLDLVNSEFPEAKQEVMETFGAIAQGIKDGDIVRVY